MHLLIAISDEVEIVRMCLKSVLEYSSPGMIPVESGVQGQEAD